MPLRADVPSPLAPRNDVEKPEEEGEASDDDNGDEDGEDEKTVKVEKTEAVTIDLEGFEARAVVLPPDAGNYSSLAAVKGKVIYHRRPRTGSSSQKAPIVFWDLEEREENTILDDADDFGISADGKKMLVASGNTFAIIEIKPKQKMDKKLATSSMEMTVNPSE